LKKIFISAGDPSGDIHAARLIKAFKKLEPDFQFIGIGGPEMEKQGFKSIADLEDISVVGFWEVIKRYGFFKKLLKRSADLIASDDVIAFVPVDYPGFNIRLASKAKENHKKVLYYIAPQLWAWGKERAKKLTGNVNKLMVVFPFEKDYFQDYGIDTEFVGHPLMDDPYFDEINTKREKIIAFFPGSRKQEIEKHTNLYSQTASILENKLKEHKFVISGARKFPKEIYKDFLINDRREFEINSRKLFTTAECGIIKTGTSNLEAALAGMPFAMAYKAGLVNYMIGKNLLNLDYVSLPNILMKKEVVKEYIQNDANPKNLSDEILRIVEEKDYTDKMINDFKQLRNILGEKGAAKNAAKIILDEL
jgi:lipid-A-disaccharide synthase